MSYVYRRPFDYRPKLGSSIFSLLFAANAMSGSASIAFSQSAVIIGDAPITSTADVVFGGTSTLSSFNANALTGNSGLSFGGNALLLGSGELLASDTLSISATATPIGTNLYQPNMWPRARKPWPPVFDYYQWDANRWTIFPYSVSTATTGIGSIALDANGLLRATALFEGSAGNVLNATGTLSASGALAASTSYPTFSAQGTIVDVSGGAVINITGASLVEFSGTADIEAIGLLYGPAAIAFSDTATLTAIPGAAGSAAMTFGGTGRLVDIAAPPVVIQRIRFATSKASIRFQVS